MNYKKILMFRHHLFPRQKFEYGRVSEQPPHPLQAMLEPRIYRYSIYNSHCNIVILVGLHVLVVRTKYNINGIIILLFVKYIYKIIFS